MMVTRSAAAALAGATFMLLAGAAVAAPADVKIADATPVVTTIASVEAEDDQTNCTRSRRRLWVDGEGWIVRRVTTCR